MKGVPNAHVLFIPSWYHTEENPVLGSFFRDQAILVNGLDVRTGVVFTDLRTLRGAPPSKWFGRRYQITEEDDGGIPTIRIAGWKIPQAKRLTRSLWVAQTLRLIKQYVRRHGVPDVIHAHCVHQAGVAAMEAKRNWRIPYIITEHFSGYSRGLLTDDMLVDARDVFLHADRIITVSRRLAEDIKPLTGKRDIHIVPNVVDTDFYSQPPVRRNADPFRFLFVGFLTENKRVEDILRAFAGAFGANENLRFDIGGDGIHRPALEGLAAELGIERCVNFLGMLSREQVRDAMQNANAFVSASEVETFGVVLVEAMSTGLPVIVTRCGGPEEIVTDAVGRLISPGNVPELQEAMTGMVSDYDRWNDAAPSIRTYAESTYGKRVIGSKLMETYNTVIQRL